MKKTVLSSLVGLALITACASKTVGAAAGNAVQQTRSGITDAALTPLEDLNLRRDEIPQALEEISNPYDISVDMSCTEIKSQIAALNEILGPDWDASPQEDGSSSLSERAAEESSERLLAMIADEAGGIIPYRSWVRRLSGAKAHEKRVKNAKERGAHRRTYLKALNVVKKCDAPAEPGQQAKTADGRPHVPLDLRPTLHRPVEPFRPATASASSR
ncbi:hypothetical protein [Henriciella sp.]|uniref:hypothetical protein n=1 Tax=Henriciella sp. TaxID=1968823 RepID=UPI00261DFD0A|nr:hypothetical protein [Henriciella sp.]